MRDFLFGGWWLDNVVNILDLWNIGSPILRECINPSHIVLHLRLFQINAIRLELFFNMQGRVLFVAFQISLEITLDDCLDVLFA